MAKRHEQIRYSKHTYGITSTIPTAIGYNYYQWHN